MRAAVDRPTIGASADLLVRQRFAVRLSGRERVLYSVVACPELVEKDTGVRQYGFSGILLEKNDRLEVALSARNESFSMTGAIDLDGDGIPEILMESSEIMDGGVTIAVFRLARDRLSPIDSWSCGC